MACMSLGLGWHLLASVVTLAATGRGRDGNGKGANLDFDGVNGVRRGHGARGCRE